jgi:hypothetical protein
MSKRKSLIAAIFLPVLVGSIGLNHLAQQPRFQLYRAVDVVQLLGSGACYGVALMAFFQLLLGKRGD